MNQAQIKLAWIAKFTDLVEYRDAAAEEFWWAPVRGYRVTVEFVKGLTDYVIRNYYGNGRIHWQENYVNGVKHGTCKGWYKSGELSWEHRYIKGLKHGACNSYYQSGRLIWEEHYADDVLHGLNKSYDEDGTMFEEVNYENGKLVTNTNQGAKK